MRKAFVRDADGDGVIPVRISPETFEETDQYRILENNRRVRGMKYDMPGIGTLRKVQVPEDVMEMLTEHLQWEEMLPELKAVHQCIGLGHPGVALVPPGVAEPYTMKPVLIETIK